MAWELGMGLYGATQKPWADLAAVEADAALLLGCD